MIKLFEIDNYYGRLLDRDQDVERLQHLCEACHDYYELVDCRQPAPNEAADLFDDLPPGVDLERKKVIGIFDPGDQLVGLIDMIIDYPTERTWYIGLMFIKPGVRGEKIGSRMMKEVQTWVASQGGEKIGLGVVEVNGQGLNFWSKVGFQVVKVYEDQEYGGRKMKVYYMEHEISKIEDEDSQKERE